MQPSRPKTLFLPVLGLLAAVLVLLSVVTVTTYFNLISGRDQARHVLEAQGSAIVSGLAAGLRTSWRHWLWQTDSIQSLVQEMAQSGDVDFVALLDVQGLVLAHSNPELVGRSLKSVGLLYERLKEDQVVGWFNRNNLYLTGRKLSENETQVPRRMRMMMREHNRGLDQIPKPAAIVVGLKTKAYQEARDRQFRHSLVMAGLLFVLGSGAIYFIFVIQNYKTVDRTLSNLSTYTSGLVDNMPNGLITLDADQNPIMINNAARDLFGWGQEPEKDLEGRPPTPELAAEFGPRLQEGQTILEEEFEAVIDGEVMPLAVSAASVPTGAWGRDRPGLLFILRDLRQIRALEEQVHRSEKLASVGRLAAGVAHEVRNPLSSMRGLARFLSRNLEPSGREAQYFKVMIDEIDRINRVITGLLDFARPRNPDLSLIDLNEVARHTTDLIADDLRQMNIRLILDLDSKPVPAPADRDQVIQVLLNLLLNSMEAMAEDGGRLLVSAETGAGQAVLSVEDTGPGFPLEDRASFLDPFFTTKKKGTGLGLAQAAAIMEAHKGRIELGGDPGLGGKVTLFFPLASMDQEGGEA